VAKNHSEGRRFLCESDVEPDSLSHTCPQTGEVATRLKHKTLHECLSVKSLLKVVGDTNQVLGSFIRKYTILRISEVKDNFDFKFAKKWSGC